MDSGKRVARAHRAAIASLLLAAAALVPPLRPLPFELCLSHRITGIPCPTCGLTRSLCLLVQGRFPEGLALHPAGPVVLVFITGAVLWNGAEAAWGRQFWSRQRQALATLLLALGACLSVVSWTSRVLVPGW